MLIIVDKHYRVYQAEKTTSKMIRDIMNHNISVFDTDTMKGINLDLTWSAIQDWDDTSDITK